jgi:tetratricopeptide (TPR) repeat protein
MTMMRWKTFLATTFAAGLMVVALPAVAQQPGTTVHGKILNPAGDPFSGGGVVQFTQDKNVEYKDEKILASFPIADDGTYTATGIKPGDYFVYVIQDKKTVDRLDLTVKSSDTDKTLDFDMSRAEYLKQMTPEQRAALEEFKKNSAEATKANAVIANLNKTLLAVRADLAAAAPTKGDVSADVANMKAAVDAKSDVGLLWLTYGDTLLAQGSHQAAEDRKAGTSPMSDDAVVKFYNDAADAYKKGVDLDTASKKPNPTEIAAGYNGIGNSFAKLGKTTDASDAFEGAVKADPSKAGMYYNNEAAVLYNAGQYDGALAAADKAIAADPTRPDPYYIKGQALVTKVSIDPKTNKLTPPPGCVDAYNKFLQLAPNDPKVSQVQEILTSLGEKIDTKFKAKK